jgi:hypothetical protein
MEGNLMGMFMLKEVCMHLCMCVIVWACLCSRMCVCMCVCVCNVRAYLCLCSRMYVCMCLCLHTCIRMYGAFLSLSLYYTPSEYACVYASNIMGMCVLKELYMHVCMCVMLEHICA